MSTKTYTAVIHKEDDIYVAECPEILTVSHGCTIDEAIFNLKESAELYLEEFPLNDEKPKPFTASSYRHGRSCQTFYDIPKRLK